MRRLPSGTRSVTARSRRSKRSSTRGRSRPCSSASRPENSRCLGEGLAAERSARPPPRNGSRVRGGTRATRPRGLCNPCRWEYLPPVTKRLRDSSAADSIDTLLRELRVSSSVFCRTQFSAPWGLGVHGHGRATFHVVTAGECWLEVEGEPNRYRLRTGDLAIVTRAETHWLADDEASPTLWLEDLLARDPVEPDLRLQSGGGGAMTDMLCGAFTIEGNGQHPIVASLPGVICVRGEGARPLPWLEATLAVIAAELHAPGDGGVAMLERVSEILLGQALGAALVELRGAEALNVEALYDRGIPPAVRAIHAQPERPWRVGELASLCAMSRSAFAERFRALTGDSPIRYLTRYRLARAATRLRTTDASLAEIGRRAGYESVFSFSRAFKRAFGVPPRAYREGKVAGNGDGSS